MLIKRNVYFSAIDEDGEERLYSTTEVMDEQDYIERLYAEKDEEDEDSKHSHLSKYQSGRGLGRSYLLGGAAGLGGTAAGNVAATIADKKGKTDKETSNIAKATGAAVGGGLGIIAARKALKANRLAVDKAFLQAGDSISKKMLAGARLGLSKHKKGIIGASAALAALGGYAGAAKNTRSRMDKRLRREAEEKNMKK